MTSSTETAAVAWAVVATTVCAGSLAELHGGHVSRAWARLRGTVLEGGGGDAGGGAGSVGAVRARLGGAGDREQGLDSPSKTFADGSREWSPVKVVKADPFDPRPRKGYLSWDDYFMAVAFLSAKRSKDPNKQVGAVIVSKQKVILGIGYNGFPRGCADDKFPWAKKSRTGDALETKYPYVVHAEVNAILNKNHASLAGQTIYVTMFPCNECAKVIIQSQIDEVIVYQDKSTGDKVDDIYKASKSLLAVAGVRVRQHRPDFDALTVSFPSD